MLGPILDELLDVSAAMEFRLMISTRLDNIERMYRSDPKRKEHAIVQIERMMVALKMPQTEIDWYINAAHDRTVK